jgi:hypothetical protein
MNCVGTQVDADAKRSFHKPEIFVAGPEEGLEVGRDFQRFFHQAVKYPPVAIPKRTAGSRLVVEGVQDTGTAF